MACTVFTIANQKGGVGKTTTAVNLAAALAERKVHTLVVDLDPQANATSALGVEKFEGKSLYGPLRGEGSAFEMLTPTAWPHLALIPSEVDLAAIEIELAQQPNYLMRLRSVLEPLRSSGGYRAIIIDCPPALGMLSMNSLAAAEQLSGDLAASSGSVVPTRSRSRRRVVFPARRRHPRRAPRRS